MLRQFSVNFRPNNETYKTHKMKMKNLSYSLYSIAICSMFFFGCVNDDIVELDDLDEVTQEDSTDTIVDEEDEVATLNVNEVIAENDELSLLSEAIQKAELEEAFAEEGPLTVFAPSNEAIEELFNILGDDFNSFDDFDSFLEKELLRRILTFHVTQAKILSSDLVEGDIVTLYDNTTIVVKSAEDTFVIADATNVDANFVSVDLLATNGVVHIIDKILIPAEVAEVLDIPESSESNNIRDLIEETEGFDFLKEALILTGLLDVLAEEGPFTVFAPSDESLVALFSFLGTDYQSINDFDTTEEIDWLRDVLLYHVVPGTLTSEDFTTGPLITLSGEHTLSISQNETGKFFLIDGTTFHANFVLKDIAAQNGIIHVVDRILIPESIITSLGNSVITAFEEVMISSDDLNTSLEFFRLVQDRLNLEALADKEFTFFFPSDQAFENLFEELGYQTIESFNSEEGLEILKYILSYHCVEQQKLNAPDFQNGQTLATFQGEELGVQATAEGIFILDKTEAGSKVVIADNAVLKGVIHVVDKVLLPQEVLELLANL